MEKKWLVLGILVSLVFTFGLAFAIPNPAPIYCENMGHTSNNTDCIFNSNQSCNLWAFYNNTCGEEYVIELPCVGSGEGLSLGYECCEGLVSRAGIGGTMLDSEGVCDFVVGSFGVCLPCGDGVCDETLENVCNCPEDCVEENDTECAKEGEIASGAPMPDVVRKECCVGLTEISDCMAVNPTTRECDMLVGCGSICTKCGNGECGLGENKCNCEEDCDTETNETETNQSRRTVINQTRTRIQNRTNITFVPYRKRNEGECPEECTCQGAVVTCPTENGKEMTIEAGRSGNIITITMENTSVDTELELEQEIENGIAIIKAKLKNGETREIKVLPEVALEKALKKLKLRGCDGDCSAELKEIREELAYEIRTERHSRILWLFRKKMKVMVRVSAENGEIIDIDKPWWAFLAAEPEE